jgi:hypothetical protein
MYFMVDSPLENKKGARTIGTDFDPATTANFPACGPAAGPRLPVTDPGNAPGQANKKPYTQTHVA